jgi:hypothetical protein
MKIINCNGWAPRNPVPNDWAAPIPITNPLMLIVTRNYLYYRLAGVVLYNFLDENN